VTRFASSLALAVALAAPVSVFAQEAADEMKTRTQEPLVEAEEKDQEPTLPNTGKLFVSGGADVATAYFFRGYLQENQGLILQPYANLYVKMCESEDVKVTGYVGTWNSIQSENTLAAAGAGPAAWYESDFLAGVDFASGAFTVGFVYTAYTYPGGAFETIQEVGVKVAWDDTEYTENRIGFALKPYAAVYAETSDGNGSEDWYGELGIAPGVYTFNEEGKYPVAITVPVTVGLGLKDYYFDSGGSEEFLGYLGVGATASVPLAFIPSDYGAWNMTATVQYLHLNAEGLQDVNNGDDYAIIGKLGVAFVY
jgi:hypothetical protein